MYEMGERREVVGEEMQSEGARGMGGLEVVR